MHGLKIIENAALQGGDILIVNGKEAWLYHAGAWTAIPDYAERIEALIQSIPTIPEMPTK
jgi:hypothetical protein